MESNKYSIHINDISQSGRLNEIKILKIWRELNKLDFPSIYLEYLIVDQILFGKAKGDEHLADNVWHVLNEFARGISNPLYSRIVDPSNSSNILSDLLTLEEKRNVINKAKLAIQKKNWNEIVL